jgi:hypothetical protein
MSTQDAARFLLLVALLIPGRALRAAPTMCIVRRVTGRPCPACGMTRSWQATTHLRLAEGFAHHPMGPLAAAAAAWVAIDDDAEAKIARLDRRIPVALGVAWWASWLWRLSREAR